MNKTRFDTCCWILELKNTSELNQKIDSNLTKTFIILNFDVNSKQYNLSQLIKSELHNPNSKLLILDQNWQTILTISSTKELSATNNLTITVDPKNILIIQIQE